MNISGRIKKSLIKVKGKINNPAVIERAKNPIALDMSLDEAEAILVEACIKRKEPVFDGKGATVHVENLYDLSVIVPVYNGEKFLAKCIDSILRQKTEYAFEVICVDDGSRDSSYQILRSYAYDSRISVIRQKNRGISGARNEGLRKAKGKYVMFIDNDDMLIPGMVQCLLDYARQYNADIVKSGHILAGKRHHKVIDSQFHVKTGRLNEELICYNGYIWGMLIKRGMFQKINFPEGFWYEDMITRLLVYRMCNSFVYVDQALYFHRMHGNNASAKVWNAKKAKALDQFILAKEITKYADYLKLPVDEWVYRLYLSEFGKLLYDRTIYLDINVRQAVFLQCSELLKLFKMETENSTLPINLHMLNIALMRRDFELWEYICKYCL